MDDTAVKASKLKLLRLSRWLALPVALLLIGSSIRDFFAPPFDPPWFFVMRGVLQILLGVLILLPFGAWAHNAKDLWKRMFLLLTAVSVVFVFVRVIGVLFEARALEAAGGELGLPAWSGTLIFLVLAQLPILLFLRFPDQLD